MRDMIFTPLSFSPAYNRGRPGQGIRGEEGTGSGAM